MTPRHPFAEYADETLSKLARESQSKPLGRVSATRIFSQRGLPKPSGGVSANGASRLMPCADGCVAVSLPRTCDWELLPAWLECAHQSFDWQSLQGIVATCSAESLVARGRLLGLAVAVASAPPRGSNLKSDSELGRGRATKKPRVIDLSALWAGPLCAQLLMLAGAEVIKVESANRPDRGQLFSRCERSLTLDFGREDHRRQLRLLIEDADIVIESSRPRAFRQLGIDAESLVRASNELVWVSITGHGRDSPEANWIAYGDDAGAAAGLSFLVNQAVGRYEFFGDAIADPLTGIEAARRAWNAWHTGEGGIISLALADVAAFYVSEVRPDSSSLAAWIQSQC